MNNGLFMTGGRADLRLLNKDFMGCIIKLVEREYMYKRASRCRDSICSEKD